MIFKLLLLLFLYLFLRGWNLILMFFLEVLVERLVEIVKDIIYDGVLYLFEMNVKFVVVFGRFGKGVFSIFYSIFKKFNIWKKWEILDCWYIEILDIVKEKIVVFVYGWFGIWNDDLCLLERVK